MQGVVTLDSYKSILYVGLFDLPDDEIELPKSDEDLDEYIGKEDKDRRLQVH